MTSRDRAKTRPDTVDKQEFIRTILETSNNLIVCLDKKANIVVFNNECERVTGYKADEVIGRNWPNLFLPRDHLAHTLTDFGDWVRKHPRDTYEGPLLTKTGEVKTILWSNSAIFHSDSDEMTAIAIGQDITDRKKTEEELRKTHHELEKRVEERTAELRQRNLELKEQIESRHKVEQALRESQQRYEMATTAGRVGVWDWDLRSNDIYVDPNLKAMLGFEDHEIRNHLDDWGRHVHPDDGPAVMEEANKYLAGKSPHYEVIHRMIHKDGSIRWVMARGSAVRDSEGKPIRVIGTDTDITEQVKTERALKESEERFHKLSDAAEEGIVIHDKGVILDANEACARMFGYELTDMIGRHVREAILPESWEIVQSHIDTGDESPYEVICVRSDGSQFYCQISGKEYRREGRNLRVTVLRDISGRKKAEAELLKTKQRLDHLLSLSPAVIYSCGAPPDYPTTFISENIQRQLGYTPKDFYNDPFFWSKQIHPDDQARIAKQLADLGNEEHLTYEYRFRLKSGRYIWLFDELSVMRDEQANITGLIGSWFEISARKEAENKLRETADILLKEQDALAQKNIALKEILNHIEKERESYKQHICYDVEKALKPFLKRLKAQAGHENSAAISTLETYLKNVLSRDIDVFKDRFARLSPRENEICQLIRKGLSSKQISETLSLALVTVHKHRELIRKKLGITNKNINLSTYLQAQNHFDNT
ncbi:MAG: PAS domain S-box protein [Candidatus Zixiibacteriota bacterium]